MYQIKIYISNVELYSGDRDLFDNRVNLRTEYSLSIFPKVCTLLTQWPGGEEPLIPCHTWVCALPPEGLEFALPGVSFPVQTCFLLVPKRGEKVHVYLLPEPIVYLWSFDWFLTSQYVFYVTQRK